MFNFPSPVTEGATYTPPGGPSYIYQSGVWNADPLAGPTNLTLTGDLNVGDDLTVTDTVRIPNDTDADLTTTTHALQIGLTSGYNVRLDRSQVMGVYNGAATPLYLNWYGGLVAVGDTAGTGGGLDVSGISKFWNHVRPAVNGTIDLGSSSLRWGTIYTSDLSLKNDVGDWTIVEGEDDLFITNNKNGKKYKFALVEVEDAD